MPTSFGSYRKSPGHRSWSCEPIPGTIFETVGCSHAGYWVSDLAPAARRFRDDGWEQAMTDALGDEPTSFAVLGSPLGMVNELVPTTAWVRLEEWIASGRPAR